MATTIQDIHQKNPFPWTRLINVDGMGTIRVVDSAGKEVDLLVMTGVVVYATQRFAMEQEPVTQEQKTE